MSKNPGYSLPTFARALQINMIGAVLAGLLLHRILPTESKFVLYLSSALSALTLRELENTDVLQEYREYRKTQFAAYREMADSIKDREMEEAKIRLDMQQSITLLDMITSLEEEGYPELGMVWRQELGMPPPPRPAPEPVPVKQGPLGLQLLEVAGTKNANAEFEEIVENWSACADTGVVFVGNTGEGKTNAMHWALYCWLYKVRKSGGQPPVPYVFDIHANSGRDPEYRSTWLGMPILDQVPRTVSPSVYHGTSEDLGKWLNPVWDVYRYRMKNKLDISHDVIPVVVVIDEATSHMSCLQKKEAEQVAERLKALKTGAEKFGIFVWIGTHDLTQDHTGISSTFYRNNQLVMGAQSAQSPLVMKSAQKTFAPGTLECAAQMLRDPNRPPKAPACFVTTLPVTHGITGILDRPPLSNRQMELPWTPADLSAEGVDPFASFDKTFEEKHGMDPDDAEPTPPTDSEIPAPQPDAKGIQGRDLRKPTAATDLLEQFRFWYQETSKARGGPPTDDQIRGFWVARTPGREPLTDKAIRHLRDLAEGRR